MATSYDLFRSSSYDNTVFPRSPTITETILGSPSVEPVPSINTSTYTGYATTALGWAQQYMVELGVASRTLTEGLGGIPDINPIFPNAGAAPAVQVTTPPEFLPITFAAPGVLPTPLNETLNVDAYLPAPFDEDPPALNFGSAPAAFSQTVPVSPGIDTTFTMPTLSLTLPAPPSLLSINVRQFDGITIPTIDETIPVLDVIAPSVVEYNPGASYTSALLSELQATLLDRIQNGGTGLSPAVEQAIWDRAREREAIAFDDAIRELERVESLGYAFPPGVYMDARLKITTEMQARQISLSREIAIKQAELELENVKQAIDRGVALEAQMMNYTNQVEQRIFESCKYATEAGIAIYNAKVQAYAAYLDAYKTKIAIYDAQIRAELSRVEAYKAEMQAESAKAEINTALVAQFRAQIEGALANVEVFKAEVGAIQSRAQIEKLKIDIFGEQVRAYAAQIGAYTASVEGFRASIQAEASKQEAYKSKVEAFRAGVQAAVAAAEAKIEEFKGKVAAKTAEWEGYKAVTQGDASRAQAVASSNSSLADRYRAEVAGVVSYNELLTKQWQVALDQAQRVTEISLSAAKAKGDLVISSRGLALDATKVGAQVAAQIGAAALNAVNYSFSNSASSSLTNSTTLGAQVSISSSVSDTYVDSRSDVNSTSNNTSNIYTYSGSV